VCWSRPVEQAIRELQLAAACCAARAEDEINTLSPALAALSEALDISTLDLLTAPDRAAFLREAVASVPAAGRRDPAARAGGGAGCGRAAQRARPAETA
jgi:hypothetical protein